MTDLYEMRSAIKETIIWLDEALGIAMEDPEVVRSWPALGELVNNLEDVLFEARKLLPLHPEIEAAIQAHQAWVDQGDPT